MPIALNSSGRRSALASAVVALIATALAFLLPFAIAQAQRKAPPPSREAAIHSFAPIVKTAAPAVVNVFVSSKVKSAASELANDPFFGRFFAERFGMPRERMQNSLGSGVIVSPDGVVVTNTHVIKSSGAAEIRIVLADKREFDAKIILQDDKADIAVLRIEGGDGHFAYLELDNSDDLEVGDLVLAIGNPFGVGQTVTQGIVSALARTEVGKSDAQVFIQTDAAINPGNSGGALIGMSGRLVGINTSIYSGTGASHGIGFAIPSNLVRVYVDSALSGRKIERPWLGAKLDTVTRDIAEGLGLARVAGALVARVYDKGPAAEAGLQTGDIIIAVDDFQVADARSVSYRLTTRGSGNRSKLDVLRKGRELEFTVALAPAPKPSRDDVRTLVGTHPLDGVRAANLIPALAEELGLETEDGVVIVSVKPGSVAAGLGFRAGDIVVQIGREKIKAIGDLERALKDRQRIWQIAVRRGDRLMQLQVPG